MPNRSGSFALLTDRNMNRRSLFHCWGRHIVLLVVGGCVSPDSRITRVRIADSLDLDLHPPETFGQKISVLQHVEVHHSDRIFETLVQLEISPEWVTLVGFTTMGVRTFTVRWSGEELFSESSDGNDMPFDPKYIMADLQLALWPKNFIKDTLQIQETLGAASSREVMRAGVPVVRISYEKTPAWRGHIKLQNLERDYRLEIHPLRINK